MPSHCPLSLYYSDFPTFGVRGGGNSKKRTNVVAQTTLLKKYLYGMVNDRQLSTSLKNEASRCSPAVRFVLLYIDHFLFRRVSCRMTRTSPFLSCRMTRTSPFLSVPIPFCYLIFFSYLTVFLTFLFFDLIMTRPL